MRKITSMVCLLLLGSITLVSCLGEGIEKEKTNNSEYDVTFLFEKDGIKVYRFFDGSQVHYFTSSGETISTDHSRETKREENIKRNNIAPEAKY